MGIGPGFGHDSPIEYGLPGWLEMFGEVTPACLQSFPVNGLIATHDLDKRHEDIGVARDPPPDVPSSLNIVGGVDDHVMPEVELVRRDGCSHVVCSEAGLE